MVNLTKLAPYSLKIASKNVESDFLPDPKNQFLLEKMRICGLFRLFLPPKKKVREGEKKIQL
jgi:hypothetical protein